jgi:hypothetical protein
LDSGAINEGRNRSALKKSESILDLLISGCPTTLANAHCNNKTKTSRYRFIGTWIVTLRNLFFLVAFSCVDPSIKDRFSFSANKSIEQLVGTQVKTTIVWFAKNGKLE